MSSDLITWFQWFFPFMYNVFYSIKFPGTNVRLIYFFILFALLAIVFNLVRRMLFQPAYRSKNSKGAKSNASGGDNG